MTGLFACLQHRKIRFFFSFVGKSSRDSPTCRLIEESTGRKTKNSIKKTNLEKKETVFLFPSEMQKLDFEGGSYLKAVGL
jgi:hypothetical protein